MAGSTGTRVESSGGDPRPPARIHILLARSAPVGLAWRRGPSKLVCAVGWNRLDDTFLVGQWFKGRIYERRSDLSPDGRYLIYFGLQGRQGSNVSTSFTAISKAPYLKPIAQWDKADSLYGGGLFADRITYWINDERSHKPVRLPRDLQKAAHYQGENTYGSDCASVYFLRLQRDGWVLKDYRDQPETDRVGVFEKPADKGWILRKVAHSTAATPDAHELIHASKGTQLAFPDWEWADMDRSRLVWSKEGKLFAAQLGENGLQGEKEIYDFNLLSFVARPVPY